MRCRECESLVWDYLDDALPATQRQLVAGHLAGCPQCTAHYHQLRSLPVPRGQLRVLLPSADFTVRLMQRIAPLPSPNDLALQQARTSRAFSGPVGTIIAFSAAVAAILLGVISTSAMAIFSGGTIAVGNPGEVDGSFALVLRTWAVGELWPLVTWPIGAVVAAMLAVLTLLWVRVVAPRRL